MKDHVCYGGTNADLCEECSKPIETRIVDPVTGGMKGQKSARFGGADARALLEEAKVYGFGEEKYERFNYLKGYAWSLSIDALFRHLFAFMDGEDRDPESGLLHTAHVAWHARTLSSFQLRKLGTDDRFKQEDPLAPMRRILAAFEQGFASQQTAMDAIGVDEPDDPKSSGNACCDSSCEQCGPQTPCDAPEYESGTWSQQAAKLGVYPQPVSPPAPETLPGVFPEGCPHPQCIKIRHDGDPYFHEDWAGVFHEKNARPPGHPDHWGDA